MLIELAGARLLTDPVLGSRVAHLRRHARDPGTPSRLDAVLLSHQHRDHLDIPSLRRLDAGAPILVPAGAGRTLRRLGRTAVELTPGDERAVGAVRVRAVPAVHDGRRVPFGPPVAALGFVVEGRRRIYFAGDTEPFDAMAGLAPVDVALLPIWGWGPKLGPGHMDPAEAAAATALLRPAVAVPIHWGTFLPAGLARRHGRLLSAPPQAFAARVAELAPATRVEILQPGGSLPLA